MRRAAALALCATLGLAGGAALAEPDATPLRIAGGSRFDTAARLAELGFGRVDAAVVASGEDFPDALAGAGVAGALGGPLLLTRRDELPEATRAVLGRLGVREVTILGGEAAVGAAVEDELAARYDVQRIAGPTRYATAAAAARAAGAGLLDGRSTVVVASGTGFADALAAGGAAFAGPHAVLLVERDVLPEPTRAAIVELAPERAVVVGGQAVVSENVLDAIRGLGVELVRVAGANRAATAVALQDVLAASGRRADTALVVRGDDFADALAAGPYAGVRRAAVLLAGRTDSLGDDTGGWLAARCGPGLGVQVIGGAAALGETVLAELLRSSRVCDPALPVRFRYSAGAEAGTAVAPEDVAAVVTATLGDPRGWAEPGVVELEPAAPPGLHFSVIVTTRATGRDGDVLRVNNLTWLRASADERRRIVNDLVGHWLGSAAHVAVVWPDATEQRRVVGRYAAAVRVAVAGDVHGEGVVGRRLRAGENPLAPVAPVLSAANVAVVNLETAVGGVGRPASKEYVFRAPPELVVALREAGVDVVSLANNHALDYGTDGLLETIRLARAAGLEVVGAGRNAAEAYAPALLDVGGVRVAVVGLSRVLPPGWAAGPHRAGLASAYDEAAAADAVRHAAGQADHVVVAIHWGVELADCPDAHQLRLARLLTDAGADVVAGHHPHVLQGIQRRGERLVAYSLGNFVWYHRREPSRYTGVLTVGLHAPARDHTFVPAEIDAGGSPQPAHGPLADAIRQRVAERSPGGGRCPF